MRIAILIPSYEGSDSEFKDHDTPCDPTRWLPEHECSVHAIVKQTAIAQVRQLSRSGYDVFINLCDGAWDEDRAGIEVVQALERFGCAFTGATASFYEPTREAMKQVCQANGIDTPAHAFVRNVADIERAAANLRYPMIVKHYCSYGSIGMHRDALCEDVASLRAVAGRMLDRFGGALIEEYIDGREFTVLVAEGLAGPPARSFRPAECTFPPGETFKHFDLKWIDCEGMDWKPVTDPELDARLRDVGVRMFDGIRGTGYGRSDLRMDRDGKLYLLEINPNCGLFYPPHNFGSADMILNDDPGGHEAFLEHILELARVRQRAHRTARDARPRRGRGQPKPVPAEAQDTQGAAQGSDAEPGPNTRERA